MGTLLSHSICHADSQTRRFGSRESNGMTIWETEGNEAAVQQNLRLRSSRCR
jgi:hypothetical protein